MLASEQNITKMSVVVLFLQFIFFLFNLFLMLIHLYQ
jgi:hypothetical protein